ncbi:MAG TPA: Fe-S-cluster-containing hydrogenase [Myxococcales bacterium]|jgi:molybdopterin-containing oxidoreductase family iron-sulfur binding subunit|nr:Fe-S-cluster-containing hydrogenase [Myxococcales bacterium]
MPSLKLPIVGSGTEVRDARRTQWRSLAERERGLAASGEFPPGADEIGGTSRREFVQLLGATLAFAGASGCLKQPDEKILPYTRQPEEVVPGKPLHYATAQRLGGRALGLLVTAYEGRPTKVEGNPEHPSSLGSTGVFEQASILQLYDPQRASVLQFKGRPQSWREFLAAQLARVSALRARNGGAGIRFLLEPNSSPLIGSLRARIQRSFPNARFYSYAAASETQAVQGARLAFGAPFETSYDLSKARVIVCLDADPLYPWPGSIPAQRAWAEKRDPSREMNRLYAVECSLTVTGMNADHRVPATPSQITSVALALAAKLASSVPSLAAFAPLAAKARLDPSRQRVVDALADDLKSAGNGAVVIAGPRTAPVVHALAHAINSALGSEVPARRSPVLHDADTGPEALRALAEEMRRGTVDTLVITASNPVFTAPYDLNFAKALDAVPNAIYRGLYYDETSQRCPWFIPATHPLEEWGDARADDGTVTFLQPLIQPLFNGVTEAQLLSALLGEGDKTTYTQLREYWASARNDADASWDKWISDGFIRGTAVPADSPRARVDAIASAAQALRTEAPLPGLELNVVPDYRLYDGRFANNVWLLELPDPVTKLTWDNAALMSAATARQLGVKNEDLVNLGLFGPPVTVPVLVVPGHADGAITVSLGYGRKGNELNAQGVGSDVAPLRRSDAPWTARGLTVTKLGRTHRLAITQEHWSMEGRDPALDMDLKDFKEAGRERIEEKRTPRATMHTPWDYSKVQYKWGMAIDLSRCTGCSACMVACQSENNVPIVGKGNVAKSREMHWLRIDRYFEGTESAPRAVTQPMLCQHCETAPCEYVCPVNATVHSDEGLNEMVYNRCIGTRYCSNNCPYKVRRFNFFNYTYDVADVEKLRMNPDVTVRSRGVMEKCTWCVQRIERARIDSRVQDRPIAETELQTACQQACPSRAIVFGNLHDKKHAVTQWHADERHYYVLDDLGTRPRLAYLARVRNPNPKLT